MLANAPTIGVEEEVFIADPTTCRLIHHIPDSLFERLNEKSPGSYTGEFSACQVEMVSKPWQTVDEMALERRKLRQRLVEITQDDGHVPVACSTFPTGDWREQPYRDKPRYQRFSKTLEACAKRMLISGMHIHVGIDPSRRLEIMNGIRAFLPLILALTTSSPFWQSQETGFNCYRLGIVDNLPRGGLPPLFERLQDYDDYIDALVKNEIIESGTEIWWDVRMSARFPTVEIRVADVCTRLQDSLAVTALVQALAGWLLDNVDSLPKIPESLFSGLLRESRWQAERYPADRAKILSLPDNSHQTAAQAIHALLLRLEPYGDAYGSKPYLDHVKTILHQGTSADRQRQVFLRYASLDQSFGKQAAFQQVVKHLIEETQLDLVSRPSVAALS